MSLQAHYDAMRAAALPRLAQGAAELDALIDSPLDTRRGITLLTRPPAAVGQAIMRVMTEFQRLIPAQYFYPAADLHVTVLSLISCYAGFTLADIDPARYGELVARIVERTAPFRIRFTGLTASPSGILVQGFPEDEGLAHLREELRQAFRQSDLQQSIDQRYSIQTAHSTIIRFRAALPDATHLLRLLDDYRAYPFGTFEVRELELVANDWYQRAAHTELLKKYQL